MYSSLSISAFVLLSFPLFTLPFPLIERGSTVPDTMNDLADGACKEVTLIYARATLSPGNIGGLGQELVQTLFDHLGTSKLAVQGVSAPAYPATEASAVSAELKAPGAAEMARLADQAMKKCPDTKLVLSGYSQGAMVAHLAADDITKQYPEVTKFISSVVLFGDPDRGTSFGSLTTDQSNKILDICHDSGASFPFTDLYCTHIDPKSTTGGAGHRTYGNPADMTSALKHIVANAGLS